MDRRAEECCGRQEMEERMFVFTAKLNRKSAVAAVAALALVLIAVILLVSLRSIGGSSAPKTQETGGITDATGAARYLASLGWEVEPQPLEVKALVIPRSFSGA